MTRDRYRCHLNNWLKHNRQLMNVGELRPERMEKFKVLIELSERFRRKN